MTQIKTCKELIGEHPNVEWKSRKEFFLYNHPGARFRINVEYADIEHLGLGCARTDAYAKVGIYDADIDAEELAGDFINDFCNYLSLHELDILVNYLIQYRNNLLRE